VLQEENKDAGGTASTEEVTKAKDIIAEAKKAIREAA
jgi:tubulin-specific chaperone A